MFTTFVHIKYHQALNYVTIGYLAILCRYQKASVSLPSAVCVWNTRAVHRLSFLSGCLGGRMTLDTQTQAELENSLPDSQTLVTSKHLASPNPSDFSPHSSGIIHLSIPITYISILYWLLFWTSRLEYPTLCRLLKYFKFHMVQTELTCPKAVSSTV